jgi:hypothetical protein
MFWGGVWLWRKEALGFLVGTVLLLKAAGVGVGLVVATWLVTLWGVPIDPMVPVYALVGAGGAALAVAYLRSIEPARQTANALPPLTSAFEPIPFREPFERRRA